MPAMLAHMSVEARQQRLYDSLTSLGQYVWGASRLRPGRGRRERLHLRVGDRRAAGRRGPGASVLVNPPDGQRSSSSTTGGGST